MRISVDVGGTFTDVIVLNEKTGSLRFEKVETVPANPAEGVMAGFKKADARLDELDYFVHGTTLGTNALLTRTGAKIAIVTTKGFRDVYELARTNRDALYDFKYHKPKSLVPRYLVFEVEERMNCQGNVLTPFDRKGASNVAQAIREHAVEAVAVCFLHSYANPDHELAMQAVLTQECPQVSVSLSHLLSREYREYERTSTTVIDAYVKPITNRYLDILDGELRQGGFGGQFLLTRSGGGAMTLALAKDQPVHLIMSGPAGGVIGASHLGELIGQKNLITMDMGGTSLDVSIIADGQIRVENEAHFETLPVLTPTIDIHTIGAGGGSIAWIDGGGHLQVGPQSAGATPGPVCYRKGGQQPTFTDAVLTLGYLDPGNFLGGEIRLDEGLARNAIQNLALKLNMSLLQAAAGIVRISEAKIDGAVRVMSVERGLHPKDFALLAFGGCAGFIATNIAREIGIPRVIVPLVPANFSALGMLMVDVVRDYSQTYVTRLDAVDVSTLNDIYSRLLKQGQQGLADDGFDAKQRKFVRSAELRYQGQEHTVNVPIRSRDLTKTNITTITSDFNDAHQREYGHHMNDPVEVVTLRLRAIGSLPRPQLPRITSENGHVGKAKKGSRPVYQSGLDRHVEYPVYDRGLLSYSDRIRGPAIVEEPTATTVIHPGDVMTVGEYGELVVEIS